MSEFNTVCNFQTNGRGRRELNERGEKKISNQKKGAENETQKRGTNNKISAGNEPKHTNTQTRW